MVDPLQPVSCPVRTRQQHNYCKAEFDGAPLEAPVNHAHSKRLLELPAAAHLFPQARALRIARH